MEGSYSPFSLLIDPTSFNTLTCDPVHTEPFVDTEYTTLLMSSDSSVFPLVQTVPLINTAYTTFSSTLDPSIFPTVHPVPIVHTLPNTFSTIYTSEPSFTDQHYHQYAYTLHHGPPTTSVMGITDTGCTNIIIPMSVALQFQLPVIPLTNSFPMHFAETGTFATIEYGVYRPAEFLWR